MLSTSYYQYHKMDNVTSLPHPEPSKENETSTEKEERNWGILSQFIRNSQSAKEKIWQIPSNKISPHNYPLSVYYTTRAIYYKP